MKPFSHTRWAGDDARQRPNGVLVNLEHRLGQFVRRDGGDVERGTATARGAATAAAAAGRVTKKEDPQQGQRNARKDIEELCEGE
jgi:hypothetical protein